MHLSFPSTTSPAFGSLCSSPSLFGVPLRVSNPDHPSSCLHTPPTAPNNLSIDLHPFASVQGILLLSSTTHQRCPFYQYGWWTLQSNLPMPPLVCSLHFQLRKHRTIDCIPRLLFLCNGLVVPQPDHKPHLFLKLRSKNHHLQCVHGSLLFFCPNPERRLRFARSNHIWHLISLLLLFAVMVQSVFFRSFSVTALYKFSLSAQFMSSIPFSVHAPLISHDIACAACLVVQLLLFFFFNKALIGSDNTLPINS